MLRHIPPGSRPPGPGASSWGRAGGGAQFDGARRAACRSWAGDRAQARDPRPAHRLHPTGATKTGPLTAQDIAGPLCFAGDMIARARPLPELAPGDIVAVLDTGAYCFSAPYHFNGMLEPAVYGARTAADGSIGFQ